MPVNSAPRPATDIRKPRSIDCSRIALLWDLWTGLYMLQPWEKLVFSEWGGACPAAALWGTHARARTCWPHATPTLPTLTRPPNPLHPTTPQTASLWCA
jgi:hypothetical protein